MRELISIKCEECSNKNYYVTKNKRKHADKLEVKKFCKHDRKHTNHKEAKI